MVVNYAHTMTVPVAVIKAIKGDEPCALCKTIAQATNQEQGQEQGVATPLQNLMKFSKTDAVVTNFHFPTCAPIIAQYLSLPTVLSLRSYCGEPPQRPPIWVG
jgi:hypothetical protein